MKRAFDVLFSAAVLIVLSPLLLAIAIGIRLSSPGPVLFRGKRVGLGGKAFDILKFRSMHVAAPGSGPVITAHGDSRIFRLGGVLRRAKLDELPQFLNVLKGEMSVVGPRPEDPRIVTEAYTPWMMETLDVRPGITSAGAIYYYAYGERLVDASDPERTYVERLLPPKLAVERAYLDRANFLSDLECVVRTALAIVANALGRSVPPRDCDLQNATRWVDAEELRLAR